MKDFSYKVRQFRERAMELRRVALGIKGQQPRDALLAVADEYEQIAARVESIGHRTIAAS